MRARGARRPGLFHARPTPANLLLLEAVLQLFRAFVTDLQKAAIDVR
jgi:hypothetical protein